MSEDDHGGEGPHRRGRRRRRRGRAGARAAERPAPESAPEDRRGPPNAEAAGESNAAAPGSERADGRGGRGRRRRRNTSAGRRRGHEVEAAGDASSAARSSGRRRRSRRDKGSRSTGAGRAEGGPKTRPEGGAESGPKGGPKTRPEGGPKTRPESGPKTRPEGGREPPYHPSADASAASSAGDERARPADAPAAPAGGADESAGAPGAVSIHLPDNPSPSDPDPVTAELEGGDHSTAGKGPLPDRLCDAVGVKFAPAGKIQLYDSAGLHCERGEEVVVEGERGSRVGTVAAATHRRREPPPTRAVLRRPGKDDRRALDLARERADQALELARERARELELPIKVFRVEPALAGNKLVIYFSAESRVDFRELVRDLARALKAKVEMRQTGVRDEAKMVGGIGSCGQELCCTTWLPEFVPVSIKMAKDQGMVLNPSKVAGQCGRLKCCLVYEQSTYAEMRKGLPKVGKRVVTDEGGEGRVVEVDVLHQRVRVSLEGGQLQSYPAASIRAKFPSQASGSRKPQ